MNAVLLHRERLAPSANQQRAPPSLSASRPRGESLRANAASSPSRDCRRAHKMGSRVVTGPR